LKLLLDTHILLWAADDNPALSAEARDVIQDTDNTLYFSVASVWEIVIKKALGREDFQVDARVLRRNLLDVGFEELSINAPHALEVAQLPPLHKDPFDRILIAQAMVEGIVLLTHDTNIKQYDFAPVRFV
jgi:PIN domain nuclease of toxin-antitoxin system